MTDQPTNPLVARRQAQSVAQSTTGAPTNIDGYCAWLNDREWRRGEWSVIGGAPHRELTWKAEVASDAWLVANGLSLPRCPSPEKRAIIAERIREEKRREAQDAKRGQAKAA